MAIIGLCHCFCDLCGDEIHCGNKPQCLFSEYHEPKKKENKDERDNESN